MVRRAASERLFYLDIKENLHYMYVNVAFNVRERIIEARVRCFLIRGFRLKYLVDAIGQ